tara:strand:- start:8343 stop:11159 length:2817 start_codon:yes stop_codon:yes gene_type:complete
MSGNDPTLKNKISPHIQERLPEFVKSDHPLFSLFLKYYYEFLEAGELTVSGSNDYVIEETITKNRILDEAGQNIVLEESVGKFTVGETITGATSKATARVLVDDFDDGNRLFITSQQKFITGETITGNTSGATTTMVSYRANPVQNIQQLLAYADVDNTVYAFLDKFRDSFMESLPNTLADGIAKRKLIKNIRDMYSAKGTRDGHKLFFRILFDEEAVITYPRDNMLRVSDGKWSTNKVIRVSEVGTSDFNKAIGQRMIGVTSGATALIATVIKFREGADLIAEIDVDADSVTGTFVTGESVTTTDTTLDLEISAVVKGIVTGGTVTTGGAYYSTGDSVHVTGGAGNNAATARVGSAGAGNIDEILIESGGSGYSIGEELRFTLTDTEGTDVRAKIAIVGGGISLEPDTAPDALMMENEDFIVTDDEVKFISQEQTVGELDHLTLEDGGQIIVETATFGDAPGSSVNERGEITKIEMINKGNGFIKLPLVLDSATTTGSGSSLFAVSNVSPMVGNVEGIEVTNFGLDYTSNPTLTLNRNVLVRNISGSFTVGDALVSHTGTVVSFDSSRHILELKTSVTLNEGDVITTSTGATATVHQSTPSFANATVGTVGTTVGNFVGDSGKVSVDTMRVQDSFYYQDYSYVVRIGQSINEWRESVRRSVHPAGWNVFGEVSFASQVSARLQVPTAGQVVDYTGDTETFSPELASTFTNLFTTIFQRRLGTATDGTSVNASAKVGLKDLSESQSGKRELTLTSAVTVSMGLTSQTSNTLGPTLDLLPKYAFAVPPIETTEEIPNYPGITRTIRSSNAGAYFTIEQFGQFRINQVSAKLGENTFDYASQDHNTFDSTQDTFDSQSIFIPPAAFTTRINVPPPGEIIISNVGSVNAFDQTFATFDDTTNTFDEEGSGADRATAGGIYTDYSETTSTYDDTNTTFDVGV